MTDPATAVNEQMWGGAAMPPPGAPAGAPRDAVRLYEGADQAKNGFKSWWVWDLRSPILKLCWDLLRFELIDDGKGNPDRTVPIGLRDSVNRIMYQTDQNYQILQRLAKVANIDISDITAE